ncbi:MAG: hypothetical protein R8M38_10145 [Mariprofundaceae bacterium]
MSLPSSSVRISISDTVMFAGNGEPSAKTVTAMSTGRTTDTDYLGSLVY